MHIAIDLPPVRSISKLWPRSEGTITVPQGCQASVTDASKALLLGLQIIKIPQLKGVWQEEASQRLQRLLPQLRYALDKSDQWGVAATQALTLSNAATTLAMLCNDIGKPKSTTPNIQKQMAQVMTDILLYNTESFDILTPVVARLISTPVFTELQDDLKASITVWISTIYQPNPLPSQPAMLKDLILRELPAPEGSLRALHQHLLREPPVKFNCGRARKRRRIDPEVRGRQQQASLEQTTLILTGMRSEGLDLSAIGPQTYPNLSESQQCYVWEQLRDLALRYTPNICATVARLIGLPEVRENRQVRVLSMLTIRACLESTTDPTYLRLRTSPFGEASLTSIRSSLRDLRVAGGQCLAMFLRESLGDEVTEHNRRDVMEYLRNLSERDVPAVLEELIRAWGRVAVFCSDKERNLALLRLVEFLGHSNPLICAHAYAELDAVATERQQSPEQLFAPYWRSVAVAVVQDMFSRPQKLQQLCDLLHMETSRFLVLTQEHTLPVMILTRRLDSLQRIAASRGEGTSIRDLCVQPRSNLASILSLLLAQQAKDAEEATLAFLTEVEPAFSDTDLAQLVKSDPVGIACEMLKAAGDAEESRKSRAYQAFQTFANLVERPPGQRKTSSKASRAVTKFFERHILGIMTQFSDWLETPVGSLPAVEKRRCVAAISEMLKLTKSDAELALPQIRACLQSAIEQPELRRQAVSAWFTLVSVLDADNIARVVNQFFALVLEYWTTLTSDLQNAAHQSIGDLLREHSTVIRENATTIPSLVSIPLLSKFANEINHLKEHHSVDSLCQAFAKRLRDESTVVVLTGLSELVVFLECHHHAIHDLAVSEQPSASLRDLVRALLDVSVKLATSDMSASELCSKALGIIGCLDPNRIEATRTKRQVLVLSNFERAAETIDWAVAILEEVLIKAFKSATTARAQGFIAYVMQELLRFCGFSEDAVLRPRASQTNDLQKRWMELPEQTRITLTPFLSSRYLITSSAPVIQTAREYPGFSLEQSYGTWLRGLVYDLMFKAKGDNAKMVFPLLARVSRGHDLAAASFMLPYAMLNVIVGGTVSETRGISEELLSVLSCQPTNSEQMETAKLCSASAFGVTDYLSTWVQQKKRTLGENRALAYRGGHPPKDFDEEMEMAQIDSVENLLKTIPADIMATRAIECGSFARALFHWEQHIRKRRPLIPSNIKTDDEREMYDRLQKIYAQIDEPDGLEGLTAHLPFLSDEQQAAQHCRTGRWAAAQSWYEMQLSDEPGDVGLQTSLLACLRETGQYETLTRFADGFLQDDDYGKVDRARHLLPIATEASWMGGQMKSLNNFVDFVDNKPGTEDIAKEFSVALSKILVTGQRGDEEKMGEQLKALRKSVLEGMSMASTSSLVASHEDLKKLHALEEIETLRNFRKTEQNPNELNPTFDKRLATIGSFTADKQYMLGLRRAVMEGIYPDDYPKLQVAASWLVTARLARKARVKTTAYNAVLKAAAYGHGGAKLEQARLLWDDGHKRQAIQALSNAIACKAFDAHDQRMSSGSAANLSRPEQTQNMLSARAHVLLAKWLDASGQQQANMMTEKYQYAAKHFQRWEKGHYYLGKHYNKLLEAEKSQPKAKQTPTYLGGELTKLVVENLLRSVPFGNKYWHETIPKVLTLWLDLGMETIKPTPREDPTLFDKRCKSLNAIHRQLNKYIDRIPAYVFFNGLAQMLSRISHPNSEVWKTLSNILIRIVSAHPSQALWSVLALVKATDPTRRERGNEVLNKVKDPKSRGKPDTMGIDLRVLITHGQRMSAGLLQACEQPVDIRGNQASLAKDLGFSHKLAPCNLVVPVEATLTTNIPSGSDAERIRKFKAFAQDRITIQSFEDSVLILNSLQRPRKIVVRGSNGKRYGLLCKPKDDLRKDQRLMEFNGIINRALKRDAESSKRRLYIKTYAVTPLSEESGTLEWVEGIKPIRDILLGIYSRKGIRPNYGELRHQLDAAGASPEHAHLFQDKVLSQFPSVLHEWFAEGYPEPETWFAARLRYARSAAVMSMTGHVLGLGDRHGENILLEESTGGVFHVDFNCLFDKGLTFEKPEVVPFRLTHNMVDAMGAYGHEGPFRKSCELTLGLLRQSQDTLMTVLETFLYDPTADFVGGTKGGRRRPLPGVPDTPQDILDNVKKKLKGLFAGETIPLSVEGYVEALVREATSHYNLAQMYIGWCAFL